MWCSVHIYLTSLPDLKPNGKDAVLGMTDHTDWMLPLIRNVYRAAVRKIIEKSIVGLKRMAVDIVFVFPR